MPSWMEDLLGFNPLIKAGCSVWNWCMKIVALQFLTSPTEIARGEPWADMTANIYPLFLSSVATLVCIWCMVAFCRESVDLRQAFTSEKGIYILIKVIAANFIMTSALAWMPTFFQMASGLTLADFQAVEFDATEIGLDSGGILALTQLTTWILSLVFLIAAAVCGLTIIFTVYRRVIDLILLVPMAPIALSFAAGGNGVSRSASAWLRTFMATNVQIAVMGLALRVGCKVIGTGTILTEQVSIEFSFLHIFEMCFCMVLLVGIVKGSEGLLKRAFAL